MDHPYHIVIRLKSNELNFVAAQVKDFLLKKSLSLKFMKTSFCIQMRCSII